MWGLQQQQRQLGPVWGRLEAACAIAAVSILLLNCPAGPHHLPPPPPAPHAPLGHSYASSDLFAVLLAHIASICSRVFPLVSGTEK